MISLALLAPLAALFVAVASIVAATAAATWRTQTDDGQRSRVQSTAIHAAFAFAPVLFGVLACAAIASPNRFAGCHCATDVAEHPHLCATHPSFAMKLVPPALYLLAAWALFVGPRLARVGGDLALSTRWARVLRDAPDAWVDGLRVKLVDCGSPVAFTTGIVSHLVVVDLGLWGLLDEDERRAVVHHEHGHVVRRDVLTLALLRLSSAITLLPLGSHFVERWKAAAEMACDRHAACEIGDATKVASALIAVERAKSGRGTSSSTLPAAALGVAAGVALEARVLALLDDPPDARSRFLRNDALAVGSLVVGMATLIVLWPGDSFHHAVETVIGWFLH